MKTIFSRFTDLSMVIMLATLTVLIAPGLFSEQQARYHQCATVKGIFKVKENNICDPNGHLFIVKGATVVYGRFSDHSNTLAAINYQNAQRDLDILKRMGVNVARIFVRAEYAYLPANDPDYLPDYWQELDNVVNWANQRGIVAYLSNSLTADFSTNLKYLAQLAARYKNNPYVWLQPMNEPNCNTETGNPGKCTDWNYWQQQHLRYVKAIRHAGFTGPIVVNTINYSWDLSEIGQFPLHDDNIIYGAHRYGDGDTSFTAEDRADCDNKWANLATQFPIIVDEVGAYNAAVKAPVQLGWQQGFIDYATDWVNTRGGSGVIAFVWYWYADSNLSGDWRKNTSNGVLTPWGTIFYNSYLKKVDSE